MPHGGRWSRLDKEGRIRAIGVTSFSNERLQDLFLHNEIKPVVNQLETHPFFQQQAANAFLRQEGIQHEAWAPFAEGQHDIFNHPTLKAIAERHDKGVGAVILRWLNQRNVVVIPKSVHKERMIENFNILDFTLSKEEMDAIALLETGKKSHLRRYGLAYGKRYRVTSHTRIIYKKEICYVMYSSSMSRKEFPMTW